MRILVIMLTLAVVMARSVAGYSQSPAPRPEDTEGFFHNLIGDWIGTANEYTGIIKAHTKYFHAVVRKTSPHTYEASFEYYEFDNQVGAPVQVGLTSITTHITPDGLATNTIAGQGNVVVDPKTTKHEKYQLSELLRMSLSGSLQGKGTGKIVLVPNRIGKVSDYTSTWRLENGVLSISEHLEATFRVLFFARHYEIVNDFKARRGNDIVSLMKNAEGSATRGVGPPRALRVAHSLYKRQLVAPKTFTSARVIPLASVLVGELVRHREKSLLVDSEHFVFCKQDGTSLNPDVLRKDVLYPVLDRLNIPRPKGTAGFHCFRHSAASMINAETGNLKLTQKFLGHSNVSTTADIYTHTSEAMEREAATALERSIFGNLFPVVPNMELGTKNTVN